MKKIGLVGGTGPESTIMYYKELNAAIDQLSHGKEMPELSIESVNFRKIWRLIEAGNKESLIDYLAEKVHHLGESGAQIISLTACTTHIVYEEVANRTGVSLVSIPQTVRDEILAKGYKRVGLLGTIFTMEQDFMKKDLTQAGIEVIVPEKEDRELIAKRIYEELEVGVVKESTLQEFIKIITKMRQDHAIEAIILGCTELPLILNNKNCTLPCLDSVQIHIKRLIKLAMEE